MALSRRKRSGYARLGKMDFNAQSVLWRKVFSSYPVWKTSLFMERSLLMLHAFEFLLFFPKRKAFTNIHRNVSLVHSVMRSSKCNKLFHPLLDDWWGDHWLPQIGPWVPCPWHHFLLTLSGWHSIQWLLRFVTNPLGNVYKFPSAIINYIWDQFQIAPLGWWVLIEHHVFGLHTPLAIHACACTKML